MDKSKYIDQAMQFLKDTGTYFSIEKAVPQKRPNWSKEGEKHGINYSVTLSNNKGKYVFDYWGSVLDADRLATAKKGIEKGRQSAEFIETVDFVKKTADNIIPKYEYARDVFYNSIDETIDHLIRPDAYDVLACLDVMYNDTFEDFCFNFGYDDDSLTAKKIYDASMIQDRMLRKLFTSEELEKLKDIN